jgi:ketosteroid isomerase-like protein
MEADLGEGSAALAGRLPVLFRDRIFKSYGSLMLTFTAIAAASYSYLVGAALIGVGSTRLGILGYLVGLILGMSFVSLAGGSLSFRYGVDPVDASKASLGMRGSILLLVGVLVCTLGWANVLLAMTAEATVHIVHIKGFNSGAPLNVEVTLTGFALIIAIWLLVRRGAVGMELHRNATAKEIADAMYEDDLMIVGEGEKALYRDLKSFMGPLAEYVASGSRCKLEIIDPIRSSGNLAAAFIFEHCNATSATEKDENARILYVFRKGPNGYRVNMENFGWGTF